MKLRVISVLKGLLALGTASCATTRNTSPASEAAGTRPDTSAVVVAPTASTPNRATPKPMGAGKINASAKPRVMPSRTTATSPSQEVEGGLGAKAVIGAPKSESDRSAAIEAFTEGSIYMGNHDWARAAESFHQAVMYDGSVAKYHAALGQVMMIQQRWVDAQAAYSAAVLLDLDNKGYQAQLKKARSNR